MTLNRLFEGLDICIDAGFLNVKDEKTRQIVLDYQRGLKSLLATATKPVSDNVVHFDDEVRSRRLAAAVSQQRQKQIAVARDIHKRGVNEFGDDVFDFDD